MWLNRPMDLKKILKEEKVQNLPLRPGLCLDQATPLGVVLETMKRGRTGCVLLVGGDKKVSGIFTERDALTRVAEQKVDLKTPIGKLMTPNPKVLRTGDSIALAIRLMSQGGHRHLPIVDQEGGVRGVVSVRSILVYLAEHFPYGVYNLPPDPGQIIRAPEGA